MAIEINLQAKVAIVTGAGRGIGRAVSFCLATAGAAVCVTARTRTQIEETAHEVEHLGCPVLSVEADTRDADSVTRVVEYQRECGCPRMDSHGARSALGRGQGNASAISKIDPNAQAR